MAPFVVHSIPGSPFGRSVLMALEEKHAKYRFQAVAPAAMKSEPHLSRHPFGRVPALDHRDLALYETQAILRYLDRVLVEPRLTPSEPAAAARMDQVMNINDWYLFQGVANVIVFHRVIGPRLLGVAPDEAAIAAAMPQAYVVFGEFAQLLGSQPYFAGDQLSLADLMVAPQLDFFAGTPEWAPLTANKPNLLAWLDRMNRRASMQATTWTRVSKMAQAA
jgi:glutathione S-transferase